MAIAQRLAPGTRSGQSVMALMMSLASVAANMPGE